MVPRLVIVDSLEFLVQLAGVDAVSIFFRIKAEIVHYHPHLSSGKACTFNSLFLILLVSSSLMVSVGK